MASFMESLQRGNFNFQNQDVSSDEIKKKELLEMFKFSRIKVTLTRCDNIFGTETTWRLDFLLGGFATVQSIDDFPTPCCAFARGT